MQTDFFVPVNGKLRLIDFDDVVLIRAKDKYCEIVTVKKEQLLTNLTMKYIEQKLPENLFIRVNRSHIVSRKKIVWLEADYIEINSERISINKKAYKRITERSLVLCPHLDKKLKKEIDAINTEQYVAKVKPGKRKIK
jgi:DNA-binding LytR/AlgR family response regulator